MLALDGHSAQGVRDESGNLLSGGDFFKTLKVLPGDVDGNGPVTAADLVLVRNMLPGFGGTPTIYGDIDGNNVVDINDYNFVKRRAGNKLPIPRPPVWI
jgi:hypothetical protein